MRSATVKSQVTTVTSLWPPRARTSSRAVVPESTSTESPSATMSAAARPTARLASTFTLTLRSWMETVSARDSETAPPWVRRSRPAASSSSRSERTVTRDTPKSAARSATWTEASRSSSSMMAARRSSPNERPCCDSWWAMVLSFAQVLWTFSFPCLAF